MARFELQMQTRKCYTYHQGSAHNGVWSFEADQLVGNVHVGNTTGVGHHVTKITNMSFLISWTTVGFAEWVEVGTGRSAAIGVVAKLVH